MKSSLSAGSFSWQSASLPGRPAISSAPLRRVSSRALRAASRARAASTTLPAIARASSGFSSRNSSSFWLTIASTTPLTSLETSLSLVCEENFGSGTLTDSTAIRPSRMSSPDSATFAVLLDAGRFDVVRQRARQRRAEAGEVRAAVLLRNVVGEAEHRFLVRVGPLHRDVDRDAFVLRRERDNLLVQRRFQLRQVLDERADAALVLEHVVRSSCARRGARS